MRAESSQGVVTSVPIAAGGGISTSVQLSSDNKSSTHETSSSSHNSATTSTAPISVAERIAALQQGSMDSNSSTTCKPPAASYKLPIATRPPTTTNNCTTSQKIDALADRIAAFQKSKTTSTATGDGSSGNVALLTPGQSSRRQICKRSNDNLFPTDAIVATDDKTCINEMGFPSSNNYSSEVKMDVLTPTWKAIYCVRNKAAAREAAVSSSDEVKFSAAILTQSPQVTSETGCEGDEREAVEVAVIKLDVDEEGGNNILNDDDKNVNQTGKKCCNDSTAELPIFTYTIPLKGGMPKKVAASELSEHPDQDTNAHNDASISFESLPPEYLNSTWNMSPEKFDDPFKPVSPDDLFVIHGSSGDVDGQKEDTTAAAVKEATGSTAQRVQKLSLVSEARAALLAKRAERQGAMKLTENEPNLQESPSEEFKCLPRDLFHRNDDEPKELASSENLFSPKSVDHFEREFEAMKLHLEDMNNKSSAEISAITPTFLEESVHSNYTSIFEGKSRVDVEQKRHLQDQSVDTSLIVQNADNDCFNAKQLITKSITSKKALMGVIESSLGLIADKVSEGYDLVASEFHENIRNEVLL